MGAAIGEIWLILGSIAGVFVLVGVIGILFGKK